MEQLNKVIFYTIDKAIRIYRQYAQKEFIKAGLKITIDQWLIIKTISENPEMTQQKLSESVFKDNASVTRIIAILVKAGYLKRKANRVDKRRNQLKITVQGKRIISNAHAIVLRNRSVALKGLSKKQIENMKNGLFSIIKNCSE
jgi:MarR family transcriptional regulator for hemolysin